MRSLILLFSSLLVFSSCLSISDRLDQNLSTNMNHGIVIQQFGEPFLEVESIIELVNVHSETEMISAALAAEYSTGIISKREFFIRRFFQADNSSSLNSLLEKMKNEKSSRILIYKGDILGREALEVLIFQNSKFQKRYIVWPNVL